MKLGAWMIMLTVMVLFINFAGMSIGGLNTIPETLHFNMTSSDPTTWTADIESSSLWLQIFESAGIFALLIGVGTLIVGFFARGYDVSLAILPVISFVGTTYILTFWGIIKYTMDLGQLWMTSLVFLIFGGMAVGFIMSLVDYFAGR